MHLCNSILIAKSTSNMHKINFYVFLFCLFCVSNISFSQLTTPFSSLNSIGELNDNSFANNLAMGGLGISNGSYWHLNNQNPAALVYNRFTVFEMGLSADVRQIINSTSKDINGNGNINHIGFGIPLIKGGKWVSSMGFNPYSTVSYNLADMQLVDQSSALVRFEYSGTGGLTEAYWAHGFKLSKEIALGLKGSYIFGKITNTTSAQLSNENQFYSTYFEESLYNDVTLNAGFFYKKEILENKFIKVGLVYDLKSSLNAERFSRLERRIPGSSSPVALDTLLKNELSSFSIPRGYGIGISYEILDKASFGFEMKVQPWNSLSGFSDNSSIFYRNAFQLSAGLEIIPDAENVNSYLKRVTYRTGIIYKSMPYLINGGDINNIGVSFGLSLPVGAISRINLACEFGSRGNIANTLIKERYLRLIVGSSINNIWFIKRKFD